MTKIWHLLSENITWTYRDGVWKNVNLGTKSNNIWTAPQGQYLSLDLDMVMRGFCLDCRFRIADCKRRDSLTQNLQRVYSYRYKLGDLSFRGRARGRRRQRHLMPWIVLVPGACQLCPMTSKQKDAQSYDRCCIFFLRQMIWSYDILIVFSIRFPSNWCESLRQPYQ